MTTSNLLYQPAGAGNPYVSTDEVALNSGAGTTQHLQRIKLAYGRSGTYQFDMFAGPTIMASSLPVTISSDQPALPVTQSLGFSVGITGVVPTVNTTSIITPSGGSNTFRNINLGSGAGLVKSSPGQLLGYYLYNNDQNNPIYVKFYNKATIPIMSGVGPGDVPVMTLPIPAGAAANVSFNPGVQFTTGIGIGAVSGVADTNNVNLATNGCVANVFYA